MNSGPGTPDSRARDYLDDGAIRLRQFVQGCRQYRIMVLGIFSASVLAALAIALFSTKIYEASVLLSPVEQDSQSSQLANLASQLGGFSLLAGLGGGSTDTTQETLATLKSRVFLESFIHERNLIPILFDDLWDAENEEWLVDEQDEIPSLEDAYVRFDQLMTVSQNMQTGLINLTIEWKDRNLIVAWANALVDEVNSHMRERAISEAKRGITYLNQQLEETNVVELRTAIFRMIESNVQTIMLANSRDEYSFRVIDPAFESEPGRFIRPKRIVLLAIGIVFGLMMAGAAVMFRLALRNIW